MLLLLAPHVLHRFVVLESLACQVAAPAHVEQGAYAHEYDPCLAALAYKDGLGAWLVVVLGGHSTLT